MFDAAFSVRPPRPDGGAAAAKLGLGSAQFGSDYGISNARGRLSEGEVFATVAMAVAAGVRLIDTAHCYGDAETILGAVLPQTPRLRIVTKTASLAHGLDQVEAAARQSLVKLGVSQGHALLVDCATDLLEPDGALLWARLQALKDEGLYERIGISAATGENPVGLARRFKPDLMQLSASLLDQRLLLDGSLDALAQMGVAVHLRSIFLQGLLFLPGHGLPASLAEAGPRLSRIRRTIAESGADPLHAALAFALARPEAEAVIVGVTSAAELRAILAAAAAPAPVLDWSALALDHPRALDPRSWAA